MSDQSNNKEIVEGFVKKAGQYGMPTMVLTAALAKARYGSVSEESTQGTTDNGRLIKLQAGEYSVLANIDPLAKVVQSDAIGSLYHESTHSYLWKIESSDAALAYQSAAGYYRQVPLRDGSRLNSAADLDYFLDEVAAEYTENRIQTWWNTFCAIERDIAAVGRLGGEAVYHRVLKARELYERDSRAIATQSDLVGYIKRGWIFKDNVRSTVPIPPEFAQWLDGTTLDGKIGRHFDQDQTFQKLINDAGLPTLPPYEPPPPSVLVDTNPPRMPHWQTIPKMTTPYKVQPRPRIRQPQMIQDQWRRDDQLRQQQLQNDLLRRNRDMLQHQQDLRHRMQEQQRETLRRQQEQYRRMQEQMQHTHNPASSPHHHYTPAHNPFGGAHSMGGINHGGSHAAGVAHYGPVHHAPDLHIHHPEHRPHVHTPPTNPFGVGGMNGMSGNWQIGVQNNAGAWSYGPMNRF